MSKTWPLNICIVCLWFTCFSDVSYTTSEIIYEKCNVGKAFFKISNMKFSLGDLPKIAHLNQ